MTWDILEAWPTELEPPRDNPAGTGTADRVGCTAAEATDGRLPGQPARGAAAPKEGQEEAGAGQEQ